LSTFFLLLFLGVFEKRKERVKFGYHRNSVNLDVISATLCFKVWGMKEKKGGNKNREKNWLIKFSLFSRKFKNVLLLTTLFLVSKFTPHHISIFTFL
jgi:hypothetical protein